MRPSVSRLGLILLTLALSAMAASAQGRAAAVGVQTVEMRKLVETVPVFAEVTTARGGAGASRVAGNVERFQRPVSAV